MEVPNTNIASDGRFVDDKGNGMMDVSWNRYADIVSPFAMALSIAMTLALR
jgi:hypothetical protein